MDNDIDYAGNYIQRTETGGRSHKMDELQGRTEFIAHLLEGNNAMVRGDIDDAIAAYHRAISHKPDFSLAYSKLGEAYYKKKDFSEAVVYFKKSLDLNPLQTETLYRLGKAYGEQGMLVQSAVAFDLARERDPEGDFSERIEDSRRRIRKKSSKKSVQHASFRKAAAEAAKDIFTRPVIIIPIAAAIAILFAADAFLGAFLARFMPDMRTVPITRFFMSANIPFNEASVYYYSSLLALFALVCSPFYGLCALMVKQNSRDGRISLAEAIAETIERYSALSGAVLLILIATFGTGTLFHFLFESFRRLAAELGFGFLFIKPLIPFVALSVPAYFAFTFTVIALDKNNMEKGFVRATALGARHFVKTFPLLCASFAIMVLAALFSPSGALFDIAKFVFFIFINVFAVTLLAHAHLQSRGSHRRKHAATEKETSASISNENKEGFEPIPYSETSDLYEYTEEDK
jgi:tetratricopeptide (TPR) repeat protein